MTKETLINWDKVFELVARGRPGFNAFCATLDLLGVRSMMRKHPEEAHARLNDFQQGFGEALVFFPGGEDYRVCFAGDCLFVVRELAPDENWTEQWPSFCGHLFALASALQDVETKIGNPGLRAIVSYGRLLQLRSPESWHEEPLSEFTRNWLVLTGASDAFLKCTQAEDLGSKGGFHGGYFWHEDPERERSYRGTPLFRLPLELCRQPSLYNAFYYEAIQKAEGRSDLPDPDADA